MLLHSFTSGEPFTELSRAQLRDPSLIPQESIRALRLKLIGCPDDEEDLIAANDTPWWGAASEPGIYRNKLRIECGGVTADYGVVVVSIQNDDGLYVIPAPLDRGQQQQLVSSADAFCGFIFKFPIEGNSSLKPMSLPIVCAPPIVASEIDRFLKRDLRGLVGEHLRVGLKSIRSDLTPKKLIAFNRQPSKTAFWAAATTSDKGVVTFSYAPNKHLIWQMRPLVHFPPDSAGAVRLLRAEGPAFTQAGFDAANTMLAARELTIEKGLDPEALAILKSIGSASPDVHDIAGAGYEHVLQIPLREGATSENRYIGFRTQHYIKAWSNRGEACLLSRSCERVIRFGERKATMILDAVACETEGFNLFYRGVTLDREALILELSRLCALHEDSLFLPVVQEVLRYSLEEAGIIFAPDELPVIRSVSLSTERNPHYPTAPMLLVRHNWGVSLVKIAALHGTDSYFFDQSVIPVANAPLQEKMVVPKQRLPCTDMNAGGSSL